MAQLEGADKKIGDIIRDYYLEQCQSSEFILPVYRHVEKIKEIITNSKEA